MTQPWEGSLEQVGGMLRCHGADAQTIEAQNVSAELFRKILIKSFSQKPLRYVAVNFNRKSLDQQGFGHHSPIGAYDATSDRVLVLDVARYKYPPWWVDLQDLFAAMNATDDSPFSTARGFLTVGMPQKHDSTFGDDASAAGTDSISALVV
eukprot:TRINITY_DN21547_c0_g1_i1.p1 TRINITY_DN21547_c0_g1~~TRINITY_DN21547_c0_g1_i1.p1  ORF type:complete len:151 (-),score=18.12 TRINITY_DN21547_c0_g1_i1:75-527(-)